MRIQTLTRVILLSVVGVMTFVSAHAQSGTQFVATIPFDFYAGDKLLPAGQYQVARSTQSSNDALVLRRTDGRAGTFVLTKTSQANERQEYAKLVFHRYGDEYFLSEIWTSGRSAGRELPIPRRERSLARDSVGQGARPQNVTIPGDKR